MLPRFDYFAPTNLDEAFALLDDRGSGARILGGGTDLLVNLRAHAEHATCLIDLKRVRTLETLHFDTKQGLTIGAAVSLRTLIESDTVTKLFPIIKDSASSIGDSTLRNRATLVGNICNASPAADMAPALLVLDAVVNIRNSGGTRMVPIRDFFTGAKKTVLGRGEVVVSVNIPLPPEGSKGCYLKARRVMGEDLAIVGVAGLATPNGNGRKSMRLAYASVAPTPVRAFEAEAIFQKEKPVQQLLDEALPIVMQTLSPISDLRGGKEYRVNLVRVLTRRLVKALWEAN
jgi:carbon-monoxide dehydrogenase medium subunit